MNRIQINTKQKEQLLEMCLTLFPEYPEVVMTVDYFMEETGEIEFRNWNFETHHDWITTEPIHWFEFCITTLATKIWNECSSTRVKWGTITMFRGILCQNVNHPVDYLYEQFKTIKNEKV